MMREVFSQHLLTDRIDRAVYIALSIGIGEPVIEKPVPEEHKILVITDTGVVLVKGANGKTITMFIASLEQLSYITDGHAPGWLLKKVLKNQKAGHIKNQDKARY